MNPQPEHVYAAWWICPTLYFYTDMEVTCLDRTPEHEKVAADLQAALDDGESAYQNLRALLQYSTLPNLFDNHPPFQIDGNFGATAGISEMLLQSHSDEIHILPALPQEWSRGFINGLCARGGFVANIEWQQGKMNKLVIRSLEGNHCHLRYGEARISIQTQAGRTYVFDDQLRLIK